MLVIQNPGIREKMKAHGWGIHAGLEASHFVVFLTRKKVDLEFDSPYVRYIQEEVKQLPAEVDAAYREKYAQFTTSDLKPLSLNVLLLTGLQNKRISLWRI